MPYEITVRYLCVSGVRFRSGEFENHLEIARDNVTIEKTAFCHNCHSVFDLSVAPDMSADVPLRSEKKKGTIVAMSVHSLHQ